MTFDEFTEKAISFANDKPNMLFGKALQEALRWNREDLLKTLPDISKENNPSAPAIFAWFYEVSCKW